MILSVRVRSMAWKGDVVLYVALIGQVSVCLLFTCAGECLLDSQFHSLVTCFTDQVKGTMRSQLTSESRLAR